MPVSLFRHRSTSSDDPVAGVEAFWRWWVDEGSAACAGAIAQQTPDAIVDVLTERVGAVAERDFRAEGRTMEQIGLAGESREAVQTMLREGL